MCTKGGPPGLEHPSQVANWQAHCACAAAGPVPRLGMGGGGGSLTWAWGCLTSAWLLPNAGTVTPVEDAGPRPPARRRRQLAARLGARSSSNRGRPSARRRPRYGHAQRRPPVLGPWPRAVPRRPKTLAPDHRQLASGLARAEDHRRGGLCDSLAHSLRSPPAARIRTGAGADGEVCFAQI